MKFIIKDDIKAADDAQRIYTAACVFDNHKSKLVKSNINTLLASKEGLMASFGAGFAKGMVSDSNTSSKSALPGLMQLLMRL